MEIEKISEAHRLNNWVAVSVAIISAFLAVTKVKDDNIVQAMLLTKSNAVDTWSEYQSKRIKQHIAELGISIQASLGESSRTSKGIAQEKPSPQTIERYEAEEMELKKKAKAYEQEYDRHNFRDDQFDLSDAALSISLAMLAVTALTSKRWLLWTSLGFAGFGFVMGMAGLLGINIHPGWLTALLS